MNLYSGVSELKGVGYKRADLFKKMGISTVYDLLTFFPRDYEDWSRIYSIKDAPTDVNVCVKAYVGSAVRKNYIRNNLTVYKLDATDGESVMDISFFNNKYAASALENGTEYVFFGKVTTFGRSFRSMTNPVFVKAELTELSPLKPVYAQVAGLNSHQIEKTVKAAIESCNDFPDCIPESVRNAYCLMSFEEAVKNIHFPRSSDLLNEARRRFVFEELFVLQVGLMRLKTKHRKMTSNVIRTDYTGEFVSGLPYKLTNAQVRCMDDCRRDMSCGVPMNRLIQGDVGSGKTVVSAAAVYNCVKNGFQAALMAPTEVLAQQHFKTFSGLFSGSGINTALLIGSTSAKEKKAIKEKLKNGEIDFLIGTHALIQKDVEFSNLGLTVTDEQHRFGVNQRFLLNSKGNNPHILIMSATPIPRTLSFLVYGDLDLSLLDEMPAGRVKTETYLIPDSIRERAYGYVKKHLVEGRQGYIICPLVEDESEEYSDTVASKKLFEELSDGFFKGFRLGLLYGSMKPAEKKSVMDSFAAGDIDLLISTTVVEVGVDVPNAVIIVIENAERFGLAQLHQLRGRVGRGKYKSTCILVSADTNPQTNERLNIIVKNSDGFKIADEDYRLRGPGDIFGSRQHGLPSLRCANLAIDSEVIKETHIAAENLMKNNPSLEGVEYDLLKKNVNYMFSKGITLN